VGARVGAFEGGVDPKELEFPTGERDGANVAGLSVGKFVTGARDGAMLGVVGSCVGATLGSDGMAVGTSLGSDGMTSICTPAQLKTFESIKL